MLQECWRSMRRNRGAVRFAATVILGLQFFSLAPSLSFAMSSLESIPSKDHLIASLKVVPQNPTNTGDRSARDFGTPLGEGLALVLTTLATDPSIPVVPFTGVSPSEAPVIEASTGQIIAPIVQSLPAHTDFKVSILIGGRAVKIASLKSTNSTSIAIPPIVGTQVGTWLVQITSKKSKYFYKVMFTSLL